MNTWQQAKQIATELTGLTPRWCDVRNGEDELAPAPTPEAVDDCIALDADGNPVEVDYWLDQCPVGDAIEAVCYF